MPRTVKVAVVGTGLAGLTAAHLLTKEREDDEVDFEVHLFEKAATIGMDSSSVSISTSAQSKGSVEWRIDVPMRSFQGGYYNNLIALYKSLGVKFRQADFSYSFSSLSFGSKRASSSERSITTTMIYNGGSGRAGVGKPSMLDAQPTNSSTGFGSFLARLSSTGLFLYLTLQLVLCYLITLYHSLPVWRPADIPEITFAEWTKRTTPRSYLARLCRLDVAWKEYVQTVLIPLVSAVCTSPAEDVMNHPIEEVLDYVWLTFGTHHYVVVGGVRKVVEALTANVKHQHLSSPIVSIKPDPSDSACVTIVCLSNGELTEYSGFHHIVVATQASGAATILTSYLESISQSNLTQQKFEPIQQLISSLQAFEYRPSVVINHTDGTLLPDNSRDARDLNLITLAQDSPKPSKPATEVAPFCVTPSYTMATHVLPRPAGYPASQPTVYQSTNPIIAPNVNKILSAATLERAIVTTKSKKALEGLCVSGEKKWWQVPYHAQTHLGPLQGASASASASVEGEKEKGKGGPAIWICGSYAHLGIPLLEGCVVSARNVVEEGIFAREGVRRKEAAW